MSEITLRELCYLSHEGFIRVAERKADRSRVHIDNVERGLACDCMCPGCGRDMVARQGKIRAHAFAHRARIEAKNCRSPDQIALLKFTVEEVLGDPPRLKLPAYHFGTLEVFEQTIVKFDEAVVEKSVGEVGRPHVACRRGDRDLYVLFIVNRASSRANLDKLAAMDVAVLEIDLRRYLDHTLENLKNPILFDAPRKWLHNPRLAAKGAQMVNEQIAIQREKDTEARRLENSYAALPADRRIVEERTESLYRIAVRYFGPDGEKLLLEPCAELDGLSLKEAAMASPAGQARARQVLLRMVDAQGRENHRFDQRDMAALSRQRAFVETERHLRGMVDARDRADRSIEEIEKEKEKALSNLRAAAQRVFPRKELAELWLKQTAPSLGYKRPVEYCVDETTLAECIAMLPAKAKG